MRDTVTHFFLSLLLLHSFIPVFCQTKEIYLPPIADSQPQPVIVEDVIKLSKAGLSDDLIIQQIRSKTRGQAVDLSTEQLLKLKGAHVSDRVIQAMIGSTREAVQTPAAATTDHMATSTAAPNTAEPSTPAQARAVHADKSTAEQIFDLRALVGKTAIAQRMPLFEPGTYNRLPEKYAGQTVTIVDFKPLAMPKIPMNNQVLARLSAEQRASIKDAKGAGALILRFPDGTKADTGVILPSTLPNYLELTEPFDQGVAGVKSDTVASTSVALSHLTEKLSPAEVEAAINGAGIDHWVDIEDMGLMAAQGAQVPRITLYMPEAIIARQSRSAKNQFIRYEPSEEDELRSLTVVARGYAGKTITEGCTSITRVVLLSDPSGRTIGESYVSEPLDEVWRNNFGATDVCQALRAKFAISEVKGVRAAAPNGEFLVAVFSGGVRTKTYKVKTKHQSKLGLH